MSVNRLREILEGAGYEVDQALPPFGSVDGLAVFHRRGKPSPKTIVKVISRLLRQTDAEILRHLVESERQRIRDECRSRKSGSS